MARYIDAEALIENLKNLSPPGFEHSIAGKVAITAIARAPVADVAEVVRCKDCKYRVELSKKCMLPKATGWDEIEPDDNDFCSYGERRL